MDMHNRQKNIQKEDIFVRTHRFQVPTSVGNYLFFTQRIVRERGRKKKKEGKRKPRADG